VIRAITDRIKIDEFKKNVATLSERYTVRQAILEESDELEYDQFLSKAAVWLKVLRADCAKS